jgi:hypothetical protein
MAMKAKHAFGTLENIDSAISSGAIDAYDILFVKNADGKPFVGWIDKDGNKVIVDDSEELAALEAAIAAKVGAEDIEAAIATKANISDVEALETQLDAKVDVETVETLIKEYTESAYEVIEF